MNTKFIEQALASLLPTHAHALPLELVNYAFRLLVQSRILSDGLKPEEEIARPHVCAEIACRRCVFLIIQRLVGVERN
jgi:origin recognition complex subunit 6